jgi:hypothetical protein
MILPPPSPGTGSLTQITSQIFFFQSQVTSRSKGAKVVLNMNINKGLGARPHSQEFGCRSLAGTTRRASVPIYICVHHDRTKNHFSGVQLLTGERGKRLPDLLPG